ncbi:unnamed protein product [Mytilus coruscus]|uniref:Caspase family p20 domain-containing protein n=1 Tax=Mytilus coruscus TaxID=42192 RepID=A0A6J8EDM0_MYTCO|nr:unnamed protein product [Mytilus coruscus]
MGDQVTKDKQQQQQQSNLGSYFKNTPKHSGKRIQPSSSPDNLSPSMQQVETVARTANLDSSLSGSIVSERDSSEQIISYIENETVFKLSDVVCATLKNQEFLDSIIHLITEKVIEMVKPKITVIVDECIQSHLLTIKHNKEALILKDIERNNHTEQINSLKSKLDKIEARVEEQEQYFRRTSLRFHNVPAPTDVKGDIIKPIDTDSLILGICHKHLKLKLDTRDIGRSHPIGEIKDGKMSIIVRFLSYCQKQLVFSNKRKLKGNINKTFIAENLTKHRYNLLHRLNTLREKDRFVTLAQEGHRDIVQTKQLLREKVYLPGIDKRVENTCKACIPCLEVTPKKTLESLSRTTTLERAVLQNSVQSKRSKCCSRVFPKSKVTDMEEVLIGFLKQAPHKPGGPKYKKPVRKGQTISQEELESEQINLFTVNGIILNFLLSKTAYLIPEPDWSEEQLEEYAVCSHLNALKLNPKLNKKRGWVLIIKNTNFGRRSLPSGNEVGNLESLFKNYHYNVRCYRDVSADELLQHVEAYASKADSKCFVCFISSHGDFSSIECMGGECVKTKDILKKANTVQLKGQPKCIFIDACRTGRGSRPAIPDDNFFVGMSSLAYTKSMADNHVGDYYLHCIAKVFKESFAFPAYGDGYVRDIDYLMKKVHRDVQKYADSNGDSQKPIYESSLKGQLFLQGTENS